VEYGKSTKKKGAIFQMLASTAEARYRCDENFPVMRVASAAVGVPIP
jgi:hypothetical protein